MDDWGEFMNTAELSERNWNRVVDVATKAGYREGVEEGKQSVFQDGFDIGYEDAFKTAFVLGKYKGLATAAAGDDRSTSPVDDILEKTRRGACYLCAKKSERSKDEVDDLVEPPLQEARIEQRKHSEKLVGMLRHQFDKLSKDSRVSIDDLTF